LKERWKHTPTPFRPEPLQKLGLEAYAQFSEILWDVLLVTEYELGETIFTDVLAILQGMNAPMNTVTPQEDFRGRITWVKTLQEILSIPQAHGMRNEMHTSLKWLHRLVPCSHFF
jgi:hypothetical protein